MTASGPISADDPTPAGPADGRTAPVYSDLESWVHEILAQVVRRRLGGHLTWCQEWYRHAEAIMRLLVAHHDRWRHVLYLLPGTDHYVGYLYSPYSPELGLIATDKKAEPLLWQQLLSFLSAVGS